MWSRAIRDANLTALESFLRRQNEHFGCVPPRGGTICFPRLRNEAVSAGEFATRLLEETGTLLLPGNLMGGSAQHFRIGYGRSNFPDALHQLESFSEQLLR
jgi:aspartate/methionine/tyrosine aminotransferase